MPPLATWETQARVALSFPGLPEEAAAVAHAVPTRPVEAREEVREERCDEEKVDEACLRQIRHLLSGARSERPGELPQPSGRARPPVRDPPVVLQGRREQPRPRRDDFPIPARRSSLRRR